ncbi:unnamed protein product [Clonostachys rhizophaga]|uniref:Uncharacterized protein n=1 Tax=Clonostachys rhizophaga TaxID=160324 RepID=A0A9N9YY90_9HYPO|nr:unnamed protein product [Clonostachys rhizophaga]
MQIRLKNPTLVLLPSAIILGAALLFATLQATFPSTYTHTELQVTLAQEPSEAVVGLCILSQRLANYFVLDAAAFQPGGHGANGGGREQEPTLFSILKLDPFKSPFNEAEKACRNHRSYGKQITDTTMDTVFRAGNRILGRWSLHGWENEGTFVMLVQEAMYGLIREDTRCIYMD